MMRVGIFVSLLGLASLSACSSTTKVTHESSGGAAGADSGSSASGGAGGSTGGSAGTTGGSSATTGGTAGATGGSGGSAASGGSAGTTTGGSGGAAGSNDCPDATQVKGPSLVYVDGFCIDSTEVTNSQYEDFVNANADTSGQISACAQNTSFVPVQSWPPATDEFNQPVVYVDWCDAYAYCDWAGKRLCGRIGGGTNDFAAFADANLSQWYRVCSNGGRNTYPYGGTYDAAKCNGWGGPGSCNGGNCFFIDVGSYTQCQGVGAYAGVFDLSGNALEWEDSCALDPATNIPICRLRGGGIYAQGTSHMACDYDGAGEGYDYTAPSIGFRCCYN